MDHVTVQVLEFMGLFLGGTVAVMKFWPQLRQVAIFFQIALFLTQIFGFYMKKNPKEQKRLGDFMKSIISHYLTTHPEGQVIAENSNIDERVDEFISREKVNEKDIFYRILGIKVDSK